MSQGGRIVATLMAWALVGVCQPSSAQDQAVTRVAASERGVIRGVVVDGGDAPLEGALVSALGAGTTALAVTDTDGHYEFASLLPGPYLLRAHLHGFLASGQDFVEITGGADVVHEFRLRADAVDPDAAPSVLTAGFLTAGDQVDPVSEMPEAVELDAESAVHDHSELAWRLRHLRRSVLKETTEFVQIDDMAVSDTPFSLLGDAIGTSARLATSFIGDLPFSGQVNLLTTGSFDRAVDLFTESGPQGVAFLELGAPAGNRGDWSIQGAMTQGDVSSWILAGAYRSRHSATHGLDIGMSHATQRYEGANPAAVAALRTDSRSVGAIHVSDDWTVSPRVVVQYGAALANYDYVSGPTLVSSRVGVTVSPFAHTHVRTSVGQAMRAPGAEEFLPPAETGLWLPPERTFAPLIRDAGFRAERARHLEVAVEHDFGEVYMLGVRRFRQNVNDQIVTLFGVRGPNGFRSGPDHYFVANGGNVEADGWGVTFGGRLANRVRGSVDYSFTRARWRASPDAAFISAQAPSAVRRGAEEFHDVTTSVQTEIPETATNVFVVYRFNTAYAGVEPITGAPGFDARFDVQVKQRLPFSPFTRSDWELLVAVRNLFTEELNGGVGVYDELLTVRPPKQIVGGLLVRF